MSVTKFRQDSRQKKSRHTTLMKNIIDLKINYNLSFAKLQFQEFTEKINLILQVREYNFFTSGWF